jgi:RluA family pseudouridine synthase
MEGGSLLIRRFARRVARADTGLRLDEWAREWLSRSLERPVSRAEMRRWIMAGAVRLEGGRARSPGVLIEAGSLVRAALRPEAAAGPRRTEPEGLRASQVLFEDEWLLAVDKPPGIPTHETADPRRPHLVGLLQRFLAGRTGGDALSATVRLGVHQRLDRDTSGVILFSKDPAADASLAKQFAARAVEKTYHALTSRPERLPGERWSAVRPVGPRGEGPAGEARTDFRRLETMRRGLLVEARPRTGRKHQIRVHLAESGLPILGDDRYGRAAASRAPKAPRLMLHASRLELRHPLSGAPLVIESPWPSDFVQVLAALRSEKGGVPPRPARGRSSRR